MKRKMFCWGLLSDSDYSLCGLLENFCRLAYRAVGFFGGEQDWITLKTEGNNISISRYTDYTCLSYFIF